MKNVPRKFSSEEKREWNYKFSTLYCKLEKRIHVRKQLNKKVDALQEEVSRTKSLSR